MLSAYDKILINQSRCRGRLGVFFFLFCGILYPRTRYSDQLDDDTFASSFFGRKCPNSRSLSQSYPLFDTCRSESLPSIHPPPRNLEAGRESVSPLTRENAPILPAALRRRQTIRNARDQDTPNRDRKGRAEVCCRASSWKGRQGWRLCYDSP